MAPRRLSLAASAVLLGAALAGGCGNEAEEPRETPAPGPAQGRAPAEVPPRGEGETAEAPDPPEEKPPRGESGPAEGARDDPRITELERAAGAAVRGYVAALDAGDGAAVCSLLAPDAIRQIELPLPRRDCAASLDASIGYRDPRGLPVWKGAEVLGIASVKTQGSTATVVATVLTRFADRPEPSIEDDVVHLLRSGGRWVLAKPSSTLYRAVGIADVPPAVLAPPGERS